MPFVHVISNIGLSDAEKSNCLQTLSQAISELLDKSEGAVMTSWTTSKMTMAGKETHTALIELRAIRLPSEASERLSVELCERMTLITGIQADRIYINFVNFHPANWGWNKKTFG